MQQDVGNPIPGKQRSAPSSHNWLRDLAESEAELVYKGTADGLTQADHRKVVEIATREYLQILKEEFVSCADLFNAYRGGAQLANSVKVFNVANTVADFILFRNTLKLVVSNPALGVINLSFVSRTQMLNRANAGKKREGYDLIAQLFPFNELVWTFHGERVNPQALVRYLFTEFARSSALV